MSSSIEQRFLRFYQSIIENPVKVILLWLGFMAALVYGLSVQTNEFKDVPFNNSPHVYFNPQDEGFIALREMEDTYAPDNALVILFAPKQGDLFTRESLAAVEDITRLAWKLPHAIRVDSIANFQHTVSTDDSLETDYLYEDAEKLTAEQIARVKNIALNEKSMLRQTISEDGTLASIIVNVVVDEAVSQGPEIMLANHKMVKELREKYPFAKVMSTGDVAFAEAAQMATKQSLTETTPVAMLLVLICLIILLRSAYSVIATLLMVVLSICLAYIIFLVSGFSLSPVAALGSPMILTLAVADCVHLLVSYQQQSGLGKNKKEAMLESLRINFQPVWLTSVTTAVGFSLMNFAESPPFHDLGNVVFIGVLVAFALSVTLLPAVMMLVPQSKYQFGNKQAKYMESLAHFTIRHSRKLLWGMSALVLLLISFIPMNRINDVFNEYYDHTFEVRRTLDFYYENMGGTQRIQYAVPSLGESGVMEPEYLRHVDAFVQWSETLPQVSHVRSFADVVKRLNRNMHGGDENYYSIPDDKALISQYVLMYELGLPWGLGLDAQIDIDKSQTKLEVVLSRARSDDMVQITEQTNAWIKQNWPPYMQVKGTGIDALFCKISFSNVKSMIIGTAIALILISSLLIFTLGSVRYGLLSLVPNLLPAGVAFGIWGLVVQDVGLIVSIVTCMTLGIVVDDTVHFLSKYVRAKREQGLSTEEAVVYAFKTVGVALIATSIILVANFGVMGFSHFYPNSSMGILAAMTITIALIVDFFLFVPLLLVLDKKRGAKKVQASAPGEEQKSKENISA